MRRDWECIQPGVSDPPYPPEERREIRYVECPACNLDNNPYDIEDCTPVHQDGEVIYLCYRHTEDYTCDLCGDVEYTPECKATRWCADCTLKMGAAAEDIIADFEMRGVKS
jgi:hypothetical protein